MDPLSIAASIPSLWSAVSGAIDEISSYMDFPDEWRAVSVELRISMATLESWCKDVGIVEGQLQEVHHEKLENPEVLDIVQIALSSVENALSKLYATSSPESMFVKGRVHRGGPQGLKPTFLRLKWAFGGKKKYYAQIQSIRSSVGGLRELIPLRGEASPRPVPTETSRGMPRSHDPTFSVALCEVILIRCRK